MHLPHNFLMAPSVVEAFLASRRPDREASACELTLRLCGGDANVSSYFGPFERLA